MIENTEWLHHQAAKPDENARQDAELRQSILTKPPGSLGRLEETAIRLAALQSTECPNTDHVSIVVFVADHGVTAEGVSAFPQAVTAEMVKNFATGGAAICVLARELGAKLEVINLGTVNDPGPLDGVLNIPLGPGTANFCHEAAMSQQQLADALQAGREAAERARVSAAQIFLGGEMGIGNTTTAAALACALLDEHPELLAGPGTGVTAEGVLHKSAVIKKALNHHRAHLDQPLEVLRRLGGFEIAALMGSYIACAQMGMPVLVDGFICSVAALTAARICLGAENWFLFSHTSAELGHQRILNALDARPLLNLNMRLGEGTGAAAAIPLLRLACALHNNMATFAEANMSGKDK